MKTKDLLFTIVLLVVILLIMPSAYTQTNWTKYEGNPILTHGPEGSWGSESVAWCTVLYSNNIYHMWYSGYDGSHFRIGHATSVDGITWIKDEQNPVINIGLTGSWEDTHVTAPTVIKIDTTLLFNSRCHF